MKILITGGAGFIASHLAEAELADGNQVTALDIDEPTKVAHLIHHDCFRYVKGSMLDADLMSHLFRGIDLVYHFGAIANVQVYTKDPTRVLDVNLGGVKLACELAHGYGTKLVFASSSEIYGKNPRIPWSEEDDCVLGSHPRWCYALTKLAGEDYCRGYARKGLRTVICRFFNFYGPRLDDIGRGRVLTCFLEKFLHNEPVEVVEPGSQTRCFTYITDGVAGIRTVAHNPQAEGETFNIGTETETTVAELAYLMRDIGGFTSPIIKVSAEHIYGQGYDDVPRRVPNTSRLRRFGWVPTVSLAEGLKSTIEFFRDAFKD